MKRPSLSTFRRHLALTAASVTLAFTLSAAMLLFVPLFAHLEGGEFGAEALGGISAYVLHLHESFWPVVLGALAASIASGLLLFERMRSPLVRFVSVYEAMARGDTPAPLALRTLDYLHDEADALNAMVDALAHRRDQMREEVTRIEEALADVESGDAKVTASLESALASAAALNALLGRRR